MTLTLNLSPEAEAQLKAAADAAGQDVNTYATAAPVEVVLRDTAEYDAASDSDYDTENDEATTAEVVAEGRNAIAQLKAGKRFYTAEDLTTGLQEALADRRQKENQPVA